MNDSRNSRSTTTSSRWLSELPGWEREEIRAHRRPDTGRVTTEHPDGPITLRDLRRRREAGEPLEYILGHVHVGSLTFRVDDRALIPRPETETLARTLVDRASDWPDGPLVDCGTGSGFLAGWLEHHTGRAVVGVDRHPAPLSLAVENRDRHGWQFRLVRCDRLAPLDVSAAAIVANLPYVRPDAAPADESVRRYEPEPAYRLQAPADAFYDELLRQAAGRLVPGGELWLELDPDLIARRTARKAGSAWAARSVHRDLAGRPRFLCFIRAGRR